MHGTVVAVGDLLMDNQYYVERMPEPGQDVMISDFNKSQGGSAANTALSLCLLGIDTALFASIGDDEDGEGFLRNMQSMGVDTLLVNRNGRTGFTVTMIDSGGERTMLSYRGASAEPIPMTAQVEKKISEAKLLLVSGYWLLHDSQAQFVLQAARLAKSAGTLVAYDPCPIVGSVEKDQLKEMLTLTDVLLPNQAEYEIIKKAAGDITVSCVATKLGSSGSKMVVDGREYIEPAQKINVIDTTGAGDAFNAGFIAAMLKGEEPQEWLKMGNETAAAVVGRRGAV